ncbi:heterokaryon incompatibility protein-domain-containing protein [Parachaetomium inaequale]|uniref:Heterokaryon incompatibility protein-domain-containing protein n=1 Tax=Parachaetomium inaequale TaxID=2588326 RepID=A0AAN6PLS7_9PEZI|nr:heterokaryon incompatibility protein-domain-containing protein [Parachaetomium inaequale]
MRLINVHTREIREFLSDSDIEPYAILSHTWAEEEVTFEDFQSLPKDTLTAKKGYTKIDYCCLQAAADGYDWAWVDTCCIDKRSSAELSEAINSMFRWYKESAVCYAYFADVQAHTDPVLLHTELAGARWFTRGWTLQELLAPRDMVLYAHDWKRIGTRLEMSDSLSQITRIEVKYLCGSLPLDTASVSKRMSWAARRNTSRTEDLAYCLLGLFDVNMALLYGEGKKAFGRLQKKIIKANPLDHTLFAWGRIVDQPKRQVTDIKQLKGLEPIPWDANEARTPFRGLLAESPRDFLESAGFSPWRGADTFYSPTLGSSAHPLYPTVAGLSVIVELPVLGSTPSAVHHWPVLQVAQLRPLWFAILLCESEIAQSPLVLLPLYPWGDARFGRTDELMYLSTTPGFAELFEMRQYLQIEPQKHRDPQPGDVLVRLWGDAALYHVSWGFYEGDIISVMEEGIIRIPKNVSVGRLWAMYCSLTKTDTRLGFAIVFDRVQCERALPGLGAVSVSLLPLLMDDSTAKDSITTQGFTWWRPSSSRISEGRFKSLFGRSMAIPEDTWRLDVPPFPVVKVHIKRMERGPGTADTFSVVDVTILDRDV